MNTQNSVDTNTNAMTSTMINTTTTINLIDYESANAPVLGGQGLTKIVAIKISVCTILRTFLSILLLEKKF